MLSVRVFIFVAAILQLDYTAAALARQNPAEKPAELAHIPGCYFISKDIVLPYGVSYPEEQCEEYSCAPSGAILMISCGAVQAGPGCRLVRNTSLKHPHCCPTIDCDDAQTDEVRLISEEDEGCVDLSKYSEDNIPYISEN